MRRMIRPLWIAVMAVMGLTGGCGVKSAKVKDPTGVGVYSAAAKSQPTLSPTSEGSLWVDSGQRADLFRDFKARNINDVITIRVVESVQALASANAKNSKSTEMNAGFDALFGLNKKIGELPSMVGGESSGSFEGEGSTGRTTTLQTYMTARVVDVMPNGNLVVEGMREVRVNNENQALFITGVVRPVDVGRNNVVLSSSVAQMAVRVEGRGVVSQPLKPGWLYRILNGVMPF